MNSLCRVLLFGATIVLVMALAAGAKNLNDGPKEVKNKELPKLFDFQEFKMRFKKNYQSFREEMVRRRYFLARACRVFASAVQYMMAIKSHYLALNFMSDSTPKELEMRKNKKIKQVFERTNGGDTKASSDGKTAMSENSEDDIIDATDENIAEDLKELTQENPIYKDLLEQQKRKKRSPSGETTKWAHKPLRKLNLEQLIKPNPDSIPESSIENDQNIRLRSSSNNLHYKTLELASQGLSDQQEEIASVPVGMRNYHSILERLEDLFRSEDDEYEENVQDNGDRGMPDEIFVDHSNSECMSLPRHQGNCGSCYAFAAIALAEWISCVKSPRSRENGKKPLTLFSEQYMVDCGTNLKTFKDYVEDGPDHNPYEDALSGCNGGGPKTALNFLHNFGLELLPFYPYRGKEYPCPYSEEVDLNATGHTRLAESKVVVVPREHWEKFLKRGPLVTGIYSSDNFESYGGGVHQVKSCEKDSGHTLLLVGHGRQKGEEYWLFRNSHSIGWGEGGYYKMSKKSNVDCISNEAYTLISDKHDFLEENTQQHMASIQNYNDASLREHMAWLRLKG